MLIFYDISSLPFICLSFPLKSSGTLHTCCWLPSVAEHFALNSNASLLGCDIFKDSVEIRKQHTSRAEPHSFVTARRLPEANHICTCPNVSKPIHAKSGKWKILKTLPWSFAFFKEFMIYFNKITLWCKYLLSFPAVKLLAFILFFPHFSPGWDVGLVIYSSYQSFGVPTRECQHKLIHLSDFSAFPKEPFLSSSPFRHR